MTISEGEAPLDDAVRAVVVDFAASPSAVCAASLGRARGASALGRLTYDPDGQHAEIGTIYDLASVTKPFVAVAFARLEARGLVERRMPLGEVVEEARGTRSAQVPLELLFAHRAGLEAHIELFAPLRDGGVFDRPLSLARAADSRRVECEGAPPVEGFAPVYSDMGYALAGAAIERATGKTLDEVVREEITVPLGLGALGSARQLRLARAEFDTVVAPTEVVAFRGGLVRGVVHDENAFALSRDGISGHAGLFGDARSVRSFGEAFAASLAGESAWLGRESAARLVAPRPGGSHAAGFDLRSGNAPSSGARLGPRTFGHLGFTGTSLWIDPDARFVGVLLTNRVHPSRDHIAIRAARPIAYDAMFDALVTAA